MGKRTKCLKKNQIIKTQKKIEVNTYQFWQACGSCWENFFGLKAEKGKEKINKFYWVNSKEFQVLKKCIKQIKSWLKFPSRQEKHRLDIITAMDLLKKQTSQRKALTKSL